MKEDYSDCPEDNFTLHFIYPAEGSKDVFSAYIRTVSVYLFREDFLLHSIRELDKPALEEFQGITMTLDPGVYHVLCWGNIENEGTVRVHGTSWEEFSIVQGESFWPEPLYYAPAVELPHEREEYSFFTVTIPERESVETTIPFRDISRTVKIVVTGFSDTDGEDYLPPLITVTNLPRGNDFYLNHTNERITYQKNGSPYEQDELTSGVLFYTPWFFVDPGMDIVLYRQSNGSHVCTVNIREVLEEEGYDPGAMEPIEIHIGFINGQVVVTIPGWSNPGGYTPEL
ncbi:MAG: FimB/Mfa2 family fimbrial subunit [Tannerellaceae bacterium]|nr:FimB/Mfa2 family fimbrial subunit [Tannerellaceae bacterium]